VDSNAAETTGQVLETLWDVPGALDALERFPRCIKMSSMDKGQQNEEYYRLDHENAIPDENHVALCCRTHKFTQGHATR